MAATLVVGTDTYISAADADTWCGLRLAGAALTAASEADQEAALRQAFERLERLLYEGEPTDADQTAQWPRTGVYDFHGTALDDDVVPQCVKDAQCLEALALLDWDALDAGRSTREDFQAQGVASVKLGDVTETYRAGGVVDPLSVALCARARLVLGPYLRRSPGALTVGA